MDGSNSFSLPPVRREAFTYYTRLARLELFVQDHYFETLSLRTAARVVGLEETYFSKFFHEKTGVCYRDWLGSVRVSHAIEVFEKRNFSITETAFRVGFKDLRTFERTCKRLTGLTPQEIKNRARPC